MDDLKLTINLTNSPCSMEVQQFKIYSIQVFPPTVGFTHMTVHSSN